MRDGASAVEVPARGTGTIIAVVGPSGAGKDTLIERAKVAFAKSAVSFPRRVVTRPSSEAERHESLTPEAFDRAVAASAFAIRWQAHGLDYAIPIEIETSLARGDTVVCNVSRGVVAAIRAQYPRVRVIYVDAPLAIRMGRIVNRGGRADAPERARREQDFVREDADAVIDNGGALDEAVDAFVAAIEATLAP